MNGFSVFADDYSRIVFLDNATYEYVDSFPSIYFSRPSSSPTADDFVGPSAPKHTEIISRPALRRSRDSQSGRKDSLSPVIRVGEETANHSKDSHHIAWMSYCGALLPSQMPKVPLLPCLAVMSYVIKTEKRKQK